MDQERTATEKSVGYTQISQEKGCATPRGPAGKHRVIQETVGEEEPQARVFMVVSRGRTGRGSVHRLTMAGLTVPVGSGAQGCPSWSGTG